MLDKNRLTNQWRNTAESHGRISRYLHWSIAVVVVLLFAVAYLMDWTIRFDDQSIYVWLKQLHISLGLVLVLLLFPGVFWFMIEKAPRRIHRYRLHAAVAYLVQRLLLLAVLAQSLIGVWSRWSDKKWPTDLAADLEFFGLFAISSPFRDYRPGLNQALEGMHIMLAYFILILLGAHLLGAVYYFVKGSKK